MNILFMCVYNSARSQVAEGIAKKIFGADAWIESAGSIASGVNPYAAEVLREVGIDSSRQRSKTYDDLPDLFTDSLDLVVTLCAEQVCPVTPGKVKRLHWPMPDPASGSVAREELLLRFRKVRDELEQKITALHAELKQGSST